MKNTLAVILGGGRGSRLHPLTKYRAKPAVPIGGKYRLIDIPISNCLHAGIDRIFVLTQFNSVSLHQHLYSTYRLDPFTQGFVEILAAEQTPEHEGWYEGTADAVRQNLRHILGRRPEHVLLLPGDHLYRMDLHAFLDTHWRSGADVTLAVKPVPRERASRFGLMRLDDTGRLVDYREKPTAARDLDELAVAPPPGAAPDETYLASMGISIFRREALEALLWGTAAEDLARDLLPQAIHSHRVCGHVFTGYWEDVGTIAAFYEANLRLTDVDPPFLFFQPDAPIFTNPRYLTPAWIDGGHLRRTVVGEGCEITDSEVERSIIGIRSIIGPRARISESMIMGADYFQTPDESAADRARGVPPVGIGPDVVIHGAIVDKNARIGEGAVITNARGVQHADDDRYVIRDGIIVIPKDTVIPAGFVI
ncbi:MAG TPA: glucose-1-phosphate adenylyltransferase [Polyangia bacterium]